MSNFDNVVVDRAVPHVLIPTDEPNFSLGLVEGYRSLGWQVAMGASNFAIRACQYDIVHHQWPEEYSNWRIPTQERLAQIESNLKWWCSRAINIFSVNNLYPHNGIGNPTYHQLYSAFYTHCHLISHYSNASRRCVLDEYPVAQKKPDLVHSPPNYAVNSARQKSRGSKRAQMGIGESEFVILVFGRLRSHKELSLIRAAYDLANIPNKRLLMAGKVNFISGRIGGLELLPWRLWLRRRRAVVDTRYVPEEEVSRFVDSCDVAIVPRLEGLSSAVPLLAMTFGRMVIAPNCGAYPEYFAGTRNLLYEPGDPADLARKLEAAAGLDTTEIGRENAIAAARWSWRDICIACLEAAEIRPTSVDGSAVSR